MRFLQSGNSLLFRCSAFIFSSVLPLATMGQAPEVKNSAGVLMRVDPAEKGPVLSVTVPDGPADDRTFKILVPEHVTVRVHGQADAQHLYIYGRETLPITWKKNGNALEYEKDFGEVHLLARATLMEDGILFHYEFANSGTTDYDMVWAVTDPRFRAVFYDPRLERTYVHRKDGFGLLAADMPERLTMPLKDWFPVRYLDSYTAPIPRELVRKDEAGITYRNSPARVDKPIIATLSKDGKWVAASFSRDPGNVWSNPELTCQHVDPQVPLMHGGRAQYELKILIFKGNLNSALDKMSAQVNSLK